MQAHTTFGSLEKYSKFVELGSRTGFFCISFLRIVLCMAGCAGQNFIVEIGGSGTKRHQNLNLIF